MVNEYKNVVCIMMKKSTRPLQFYVVRRKRPKRKHEMLPNKKGNFLDLKAKKAKRETLNRTGKENDQRKKSWSCIMDGDCAFKSFSGPTWRAWTVDTRPGRCRCWRTEWWCRPCLEWSKPTNNNDQIELVGKMWKLTGRFDTASSKRWNNPLFSRKWPRQMTEFE